MSFGGTQGAIRYVLTVDDTNATNKLKNFSNTLRGMDTSVTSSATGLGKVNTAMTGLDSRTSKLSMVMTGLKENFGLVMTSVGATMSSVVNLSRAYNDLSDTQINVDRTALKMSRTQEAVTKAQDKLNQLTRDGLKGSAEYEQAVLDVQQAEEAATLAVTMHGEALEDQQRTYENFYMNIFSSAISSVGTFGSALKALEGAGVISLTRLTTAVKGLSLSLKTLTIGGVVGLAITGIALLITKIQELQEEKKKLDESLKTIESIPFEVIKNPQRTEQDIIKAAQELHDERLKLQQTLNQEQFGYAKYSIDSRSQQLARLYTKARDSTVQFNAEMQKNGMIVTRNQIIITGYIQTLGQLIDQIDRYSQAEAATAEVLRLVEHGVEFASNKVDQYSETLSDSKLAQQEAINAWDEHIAAIKSFGSTLQGLDRKGITDFLKDIGFGKDSRKRIRIEIEKDQDIADIFGDLENLSNLFLTTPIKESDFDKAIQNIVKGLKEAAKKNPEDSELLSDLVKIDTSQTPAKVIEQIDMVFDKIRNSPELSKMAAEKGITIPDLIVNSSPTTPVKVDVGKFIEFDSSGPAAKPINMDIFAQNLNDAVKAAEVTAPKITKALQTKFPPIEMSDFSQNLNDSIKAATQTTKKIEKGLKVKFPAIDMSTYAGNLNDAVSAAKDTRKKIEKALSSDIKINVGFDVDKPPKITESGGKIDVEFAASGYQGWVRSPQMFMVGEAGEDEYVSITPKSKIGQQTNPVGPSGPTNVYVTFQLEEGEFFNKMKLSKVIRDVTGKNISRMM